MKSGSSSTFDSASGPASGSGATTFLTKMVAWSNRNWSSSSSCRRLATQPLHSSATMGYTLKGQNIAHKHSCHLNNQNHLQLHCEITLTTNNNAKIYCTLINAGERKVLLDYLTVIYGNCYLPFLICQKSAAFDSTWEKTDLKAERRWTELSEKKEKYSREAELSFHLFWNDIKKAFKKNQSKRQTGLGTLTKEKADVKNNCSNCWMKLESNSKLWIAWGKKGHFQGKQSSQTCMV